MKQSVLITQSFYFAKEKLFSEKVCLVKKVFLAAKKIAEPKICVVQGYFWRSLGTQNTWALMNIRKSQNSPEKKPCSPPPQKKNPTTPKMVMKVSKVPLLYVVEI